PVGLAATLGLAAWMLRGRTLRLHGAEHRAIAAVEERSLLATWEGAARPSRFSPRCGTNFAALALPVTWLADRFWPLAPELWPPMASATANASATCVGSPEMNPRPAPTTYVIGFSLATA